MIKDRTESGFEYEIDERRLSSMKVLRKVSDVEASAAELPNLCIMIFGEEQYDRYIEHLEQTCGFDDSTVATSDIIGIFKSHRKNS